jgi:hypothetical protein
MPHYSIYIPNVQGADNAHLERVGLGELCTDKGPEWCQVLQNGPDGGRGMVGMWRTNHPELDPLWGVQLDKQKWLPGPANKNGRKKGDFWIGWETERPPKPDDLRRAKMHSGGYVTLRDGNHWLIPEAIQLPHLVGIDEDTGDVALQYSPEYESFCRASEQYAMLICQRIGALEQLRTQRPNIPEDQVAVDFVLADAWTYCCDAIALNYRVNAEVISLLKLLAKPHIVTVLAATIALPDILNVKNQKKKTERVSIPVGLST